ncbi:MAG TPA: hypothetical protein VGI57_03690 [Usitatibacter sp.]|jgi:hypothetical protein
MGVFGRVAIAVALAGMASLAWGKQDVMHEDVPETGSNISRVAMTWPVSINSTYAELAPDERDMVRADYLNLGANDEPPYPLYGMKAVLHDMQSIRIGTTDDGKIALVVRIDATGKPRAFAVLKAPDVGVATVFGWVLMRSSFKPAMCGGQACEGDYVFRYDFSHRRPSNFIVDWNEQLWASFARPGPGL